MNILNHNPMTKFCTVVKCLDGNLFLTLSHGDVDQRSISDIGIVCLSDSLNIGSRIHTRE